MRLRWILVLTAALPVFGADDSVLWRFVHPHAKALAGVEVRRFMESPPGRELRNQLAASEFGSLDGLEILDDVERLLLSSPGQKGRQDAQVVIAVEGRFQRDRIRKSVVGDEVGSVTYHGVQIYVPKRTQGKRMALGLVNDRILLFGDLACVQEAIDGPPARTAVMARATDLAREHEMWIVVDGMPANLVGSKAPQLAVLKEITGLDAGVSLADGLRLDVNLAAQSATSAGTLAGSLTMLLNMAMMQSKDRPEVRDLANKLRITAEGAAVRIRLSVDQAELQRNVAALRARKPELEVRAVTRTTETLPEKSGSILIYGLEGGTREIAAGQR